MKNKLFKSSFVVLVLLVIIGNYSLSSAQSATPPKILDSVKEKVAQELSQIKQGVAKKGFVGSVTAKSDVTLTVTNLKNQARTVMVNNTDTTIKLQNGKDGTIADIKTNDFVIAMGDVDSENKMTAKRLLIIANPADDKRMSYFGTVTKTTASTFSIKTLKGDILDIKVSAGTKYNEKFKLVDLKADSKVVVVALTGGTSSAPTYTALRVHLIQ